MQDDISYNPVDYCFEWTDNGSPYGWYNWDSEKAHVEAKKARDRHYYELKDRGVRVKRYSSNGQLISRGGIGSGKPHIEMIVTCYHLIIG